MRGGEPRPPVVAVEHCYDFPRAVIHRSSGDCPRYAGGVCRPLPTPTKPYTLEEAAAVDGYAMLLSGQVGHLTPVVARGESEVGGKIVESGDALRTALLASGMFADEVASDDDD